MVGTSTGRFTCARVGVGTKGAEVDGLGRVADNVEACEPGDADVNDTGCILAGENTAILLIS